MRASLPTCAFALTLGLLSAVAVPAVAPQVAVAAPDSLVSPAGTIGGPVTGTLGPMPTSDDQRPSDTDWWTLGVDARTQLTVFYAFDPNCDVKRGSLFAISLVDFLGIPVVSSTPDALRVDGGSVAGAITWTTGPTAEPMYVQVTGDREGCTYQLSVAPTNRLRPDVFRTYPVVGLPEPEPVDDYRDTPRGPLRGAVTYVGTAESRNDIDWLSFRARHNATVEIYAEAGGACADGLPTDYDVELKSGSQQVGDPFNQAAWSMRISRRYPQARQRLRFAADGTPILLRISAAIGCPWQVRVLPQTSIIAPSPTACRTAERRWARLDRRLKAVLKQKPRSRRAQQRRTARIRSLRRSIRATNQRIAEQCD